MSGSSKEYSSDDMDEVLRKQRLNEEVARRISAQSPAAKKVDAETLEAHRETVAAKKSIPAARMAPPPSSIVASRPMTTSEIKAAEDARLALVRQMVGKMTPAFVGKPATPGQTQSNKSPKRDKPARMKAETPVIERIEPLPPAVPTEDAIRADWSRRMKAGEVDRTAALVGINTDLIRYGHRKVAGTVEKPNEAAMNVHHTEPPRLLMEIAAKAEASSRQYTAPVPEGDKAVTLSYTIPDAYLGRKDVRVVVESIQAARKAVEVIMNGTTKAVKLDRGVVLTLIHRHANGIEYAVKRSWFATADKAQEAGTKALAEGLPRRKQCPKCRGMGRVTLNAKPAHCPECLTECKKCKEDCRCRGEGVYGTGTVPGEPMAVHAFWHSDEVKAQMVVGRHDGKLIDRGVLALDKPLPVDKPKHKSIQDMNMKPDIFMFEQRPRREPRA